ncbi:hypothetical protein GCM10022222_23940 [Amycolatopsis ultiminotia]|uniref:Uncharacterized protein n=1 Tax=Amycolatopsis ultiminotia TaxID=543629 RepID=A0ABP6VTR5_9PSEU
MRGLRLVPGRLAPIRGVRLRLVGWCGGHPYAGLRPGCWRAGCAFDAVRFARWVAADRLTDWVGGSGLAGALGLQLEAVRWGLARGLRLIGWSAGAGISAGAGAGLEVGRWRWGWCVA